MKFIYTIIFSIFLFFPIYKCSKNKNEVFQELVLDMESDYKPYIIAGPPPGLHKEAAPQTDTTNEKTIPGANGISALQFFNVYFSSFLALLYSATIPAFIWLSFTARVKWMKSWYSAFHVGLILTGLILKFIISYSLSASFILILIAVFLGYQGFKYSDYCYIGISLFTTFVLVNLFHILFIATETSNYYGYGESSLTVILTITAIHFLYLFLEISFYNTMQNFYCSLSSAYGAVSGISFGMKYFMTSTYSPFDILSFMSLPTQFRWNDSICLFQLSILIIITIFGFLFNIYRERVSGEMMGFTNGGKGSIPPKILKYLVDDVGRLDISSRYREINPFGYLFTCCANTNPASRVRRNAVEVDETNEESLLSELIYDENAYKASNQKMSNINNKNEEIFENEKIIKKTHLMKKNFENYHFSQIIRVS